MLFVEVLARTELEDGARLLTGALLREKAALGFLTVDEAQVFVASKLESGEPIILDLFGGRTSQIPHAINLDIIADEGIRASTSDLGRIFPNNSVDEIVVSGPQAPFIEEAAQILKPGGRIYQ
jgi:hypothetical protein